MYTAQIHITISIDIIFAQIPLLTKFSSYVYKKRDDKWQLSSDFIPCKPSYTND